MFWAAPHLKLTTPYRWRFNAPFGPQKTVFSGIMAAHSLGIQESICAAIVQKGKLYGVFSKYPPPLAVLGVYLY